LPERWGGSNGRGRPVLEGQRQGDGAMELSERTIERLCAYRRILGHLLKEGKDRVFSHELAAQQGATAAQVRRDVMLIGYAGSPAKGYDVAGLREHIASLLHPPLERGVVLVGVGHLGRALLAYFAGRRAPLGVTAAFDTDSEKRGRIIHGCRCYGLEELEEVLGRQWTPVAMIAVPGEAAQGVADRLTACGVKGIVNFAPVLLHVPEDVVCEDIDLSVALEKVSYLACSKVHYGKAN